MKHRIAPPLLVAALTLPLGCAYDEADDELADDELAEERLAVLANEPLPADFVADVNRVFPPGGYPGQPPVAGDADFVDLTTGTPVTMNFDNVEVFVTFLRDDAQNDDGLGFFTYPSGSPPITPPAYAVIWASTDGMTPGTRVSLGTFPKDTRVGFVVFSEDTGNEYYSLPALNGGNDHFHRKYHEAEHRWVMGAEDIPLAASDQDFNDVLFSVTTRIAVDRYSKVYATYPRLAHIYTTTGPTGLPPGSTLDVDNEFYLANDAFLEPATDLKLFRCSYEPGGGTAYLLTTSPTCELLNKLPDVALGYIGKESQPMSPMSSAQVLANFGAFAKPLYRAYSWWRINHFYTTSSAELNFALGAPYPHTYTYEGVAGHVWRLP